MVRNYNVTPNTYYTNEDFATIYIKDILHKGNQSFSKALVTGTNYSYDDNIFVNMSGTSFSKCTLKYPL